MRYTLKRDDMPLLSQWIKKSRSSERDFLAGMARFEGSAFGLLRKQPIVFGFAEGVRISSNKGLTTSKKAPSNDGTLLLAIGYKKDIFAVFAYEFEPSHALSFYIAL